MSQRYSLDTLAAAWAQILGVPAPEYAAAPNPDLLDHVRKAFGNNNADRIFLFNPDAIGQWVCEKYPKMLSEVTAITQLTLPLHSPMPPKTPVCFGTMYTGAQPEVHGIQKYEKPVITIDTLFDALIRAGKKPVIIAYGVSSMGIIFNGRDMDYYVFDNIEQVNAKAIQLILEDQHDFYAVYNGNFDGSVHKFGPEDPHTLGELRMNSHIFKTFCELIRTQWHHHRTLVGFCPDHGSHYVYPNTGAHGLDTPEDRDIFHFYGTFDRSF